MLLQVRSIKGPFVVLMALMLGCSFMAAAPAVAEDAPPPASAEGDPLQSALDGLVQKGRVGATAELVSGDRRWNGKSGKASLSPDVPAGDNASFRTASITKEMVAVLVWQQIQDKTWTTQTTIGDILADLWPEHGQVTVGQMLSHTSGMPDFPDSFAADGDLTKLLAAVSRPYTDEELVGIAKKMPWSTDPVHYSNTAYVILGMMLQRQTGTPVGQLLTERIFGPANMSDSTFATKPGLPDNSLSEYTYILGSPRPLASFDPTTMSSAGAVVTTATDLNRFQQALASGVYLAPETVEQMRTVQSVAEGAGAAYGVFRYPDPCSPAGGPQTWVFGHEGLSVGTQSWSFTSADGRRSVSVAATGTRLEVGESPDLGEFGMQALRSTCPNS